MSASTRSAASAGSFSVLSRFVHGARRTAHWLWEIGCHPANRGARLAAERRAIAWHWHTRGAAGEDVEAVVTVDGQTHIVARPHQFSAVWTLYDGVHEWEELQFCLRYLRPGDHFVDVGANVGVFSTLVGTRIPGVQITAVEPFPPVRADLVANLALNNLDVTVVDAAVSDVAGSATFEVLDRDVLNRLAPAGDGGAPRESTTGIMVPVTPLDSLVGGDPPALVKIDVEGSELLVIQGARRLLSDPHIAPVLLFEHAGHGTHFGITPTQVRTLLGEVGYRIHLLDGSLTRWDSDVQPPTPNVIACRDIAAVRSRLDSPGGAPAISPVRVDVAYRRRVPGRGRVAVSP
jgi:FkbM family methyltransferase